MDIQSLLTSAMYLVLIMLALHSLKNRIDFATERTHDLRVDIINLLYIFIGLISLSLLAISFTNIPDRVRESPSKISDSKMTLGGNAKSVKIVDSNVHYMKEISKDCFLKDENGNSVDIESHCFVIGGVFINAKNAQSVKIVDSNVHYMSEISTDCFCEDENGSFIDIESHCFVIGGFRINAKNAKIADELESKSKKGGWVCEAGEKVYLLTDEALRKVFKENETYSGRYGCEDIIKYGEEIKSND